MNDYKCFLIASCVIITVCLSAEMYSEHIKSQKELQQLEIKKLELQLKLKEK